MSKSHTVTQTIYTANGSGPRMSLSKRRSSSVGNKAHLVASHQAASGPVSSSLAVVRTTSAASLPQHTDKVYSAVKPRH